jgi:hypothetical protein
MIDGRVRRGCRGDGFEARDWKDFEKPVEGFGEEEDGRVGCQDQILDEIIS